MLQKENDLRTKEIEIEKQVDQKIREKSGTLLWDELKNDLSNNLLSQPELKSNLNDFQKVEKTLKKLKSELKFWKSLWKTYKDNPTIPTLFIVSLFFLILSPWLLTQLDNWLSTHSLSIFSNPVNKIGKLLTTSPAFIFSVPFIKEIWKWWENYKPHFQKVKKILKNHKNKLENSRQTLIKIEKANIENEIKQIQASLEQKQQQIILTTAYKSLNDLINIRLQTDPYSEQLGLLQQVKNDIEELTNCLVIQDNDISKDEKRKSFVRGPARVVLYIDDLDRCPPHKVVEVLEAVQLLVKTSLFIVVLAIDDRYISRALEDVYKGVLKRRGKPSGIDYLEKIIQIPYRMRPISPINLKKYLQSQMTVEEEQSETVEKNKAKQLKKNKAKHLQVLLYLTPTLTYLAPYPNLAYPPYPNLMYPTFT